MESNNNNYNNNNIVTCEFVSVLCRQAPLETFHSRMCLSAVPPPLASRFGCHGHQAIACKRKYTGGF